MITRANLFPILVNAKGKPTEHSFVGFQTNFPEYGDDADAHAPAVRAYYPMFRCSETGDERAFGCLGQKRSMRELYGTERGYR